METWRKLIKKALNDGDDISSLVFTPSDLDLDYQFDSGYGGIEGQPFVAWSDNWVYFPVSYDGAEWVGSVPRNPVSEYEPRHFGGG